MNKSLSSPEAVEGMTRFGINPKNNYGVSMPNLRRIAKENGKNHEFAKKLWSSNVHETRIIASMVTSLVNGVEKVIVVLGLNGFG